MASSIIHDAAVHPLGVCTRLRQVRERIARAEQRFGRASGAVTLLAVSKGQPVEAIRAALDCDQRRFGESYLQEALPKVARLAGRGLEWHLIGPLQANKTKNIAARFDWVHSIDRLKIAERLNAQRPAETAPINVCLQVNVSGETSKAGVDLEQLPELARAVAALPRLRLRGLMGIPARCRDFERQRLPYRRLRAALEALNRDGFTLDTLSMGMSDDVEAAIAEGATLVRLGTAIFGERGKKRDS